MLIRLYTECQCPTMPGTELKVCVQWYGGGTVCKPIVVFNLAQAEQFNTVCVS